MLYDRKKSGEELDKEKRITAINDFLDEKIQYFEKYAQEIKPKRGTKADLSLLDRILYETLNRNSNDKYRFPRFGSAGPRKNLQSRTLPIARKLQEF